LGQPPVRIPEQLVGFDLLGRLEYGEGPSAQQLGPIGELDRCKPVEASHQFVVELDENLSPSHSHMVDQMALGAALVPPAAWLSERRRTGPDRVRAQSPAGQVPEERLASAARRRPTQSL